MNAHTSFYDYASDVSYVYLNAFDVSECYDDFEKLEFQMKFPFQGKLTFM
jgi:hypothetical protein